MKKIFPFLSSSFFLRFLAYGVLTLLLAGVTLQMTRQLVVLQRFEKKQAELLYEFTQVKEGVVQYGTDLNEMREYLLLPARQYDFFPKKIDEMETDELAFGVYRFADQVGKDYLLKNRQKSSYEAIKSLKNDQAFLNELKALGLMPPRYLEESADFVKFKLYQDKVTAATGLVLNRQKAEFYMESISGTDRLDTKEDETLSQAVLHYLQNNLETILDLKIRITAQKQAIKELWQEEMVAIVLSAKKLQVSLNPSEVEKGFEYIVYNSATIPLLSLWIDRKTSFIQLENDSYATIDALRPDLLVRLDQLDGETEQEKTLQAKMEALLLLLSEPAFLDVLKVNRLQLEGVREQENRLYHDLKNIDSGEILGSIIFETLTGDFKLWHASDNKEYSLTDMLDFGVKKNN